MRREFYGILMIALMPVANLHAGYNLEPGKTDRDSAYVVRRENAGEVRDGDEISVVARDLMKNLDGHCQTEEASFPIYRKRGANGDWKCYPKTGNTFYLFDRVPMNYPEKDENGGELVAIVHNHPIDRIGVSLSVGDVMVALNKNVRVYAGGCKQRISPYDRGLVYVDPENGFISSVSGTDGTGLNFRKSGPNEVCPVGGYDFKKSVIAGDDLCIPIRDDFKISENITDKEFEDKFARMAYHPNYFRELSKYAESQKLRKKQSGEQLASDGNVPETGVPSSGFDAGKTIAAGETNTNETSGEVGIRGWCKCGDNRGKKLLCGYGVMNIFVAAGCAGVLLGSEEVSNNVLKDALKDNSIETECPYVYTLCGRCGKCMRSEDIVDVKVLRRLYAEGKPTDIKGGEMKKAQDRLKAIPDGQVVVPGKCSCKEPDVIKTGFFDNQEFYVCLLCGRVYVPVNCNVPIGPTARREMGLKDSK